MKLHEFVRAQIDADTDDPQREKLLAMVDRQQAYVEAAGGDEVATWAAEAPLRSLADRYQGRRGYDPSFEIRHTPS